MGRGGAPFGFITSDSGGENMFFHANDVSYGAVAEGDTVEFLIVPDRKDPSRLIAVDVVPFSSRPMGGGGPPPPGNIAGRGRSRSRDDDDRSRHRILRAPDATQRRRDEEKEETTPEPRGERLIYVAQVPPAHLRLSKSGASMSAEETVSSALNNALQTTDSVVGVTLRAFKSTGGYSSAFVELSTVMAKEQLLAMAGIAASYEGPPRYCNAVGLSIGKTQDKVVVRPYGF